MPFFKTTLQKFGQKGEKTGWTFIEIPEDVILQLRPHQKTSFRVKGRIDNYPLRLVALLPMGDSSFIMPINTLMRRGIRKESGAAIEVEIEVDDDELPPSDDLLECLQDEPKAILFFNALTKSHQNYFHKWIESAKTIETKSKRISMTVKALAMNMDYGSMIRYFKNKKNSN